MNLLYGCVLFLLPVLLPLMASGQSSVPREVMKFITAGDTYYQEEQYAKAASFYERALVLDSSHAYAHYRVAECFRKTFDYSLALSHYQKVTDLAPEKYPVVFFYFPLMQKLEGKFASADANFTTFIRHADKHPFEGSGRFIEKAKLEREGCRYAMAQLTGEFSDYGFRHPDATLNSAYNDYAPWIFDNDSTLVFTSGRPSVTGNRENNRYGEYFSDNLRYSKDSTGWHPVKDTDNFSITNSPFIEGTGSFNRERTKFYFTGCYAETGCKIYVSVKEKGKWSAPELLNQNINPKGEDAKQPCISPGADTLFFVSGRPGGLGGNDIWMSLADSTAESWGVPVNLGGKINTPYNETAPFFYSSKNLLFFSSDGHRGFGGLDIFAAAGSPLKEASVHNIGFPFNSSSDESYMVLGETIGYLSSNRPGSLGGFDIYRYEMASTRFMIHEITNEGSGGRILHSRVRNLSTSDILVMRDEDKFFYRDLPADEKERVDRIIAFRLAALNGYGEVPLTRQDEAYFRQLSASKQAGISRIARLLQQSRRQHTEQLLRKDSPSWHNTIFTSEELVAALAEVPDGRLPEQEQRAVKEVNAADIIDAGVSDSSRIAGVADQREAENFPGASREENPADKPDSERELKGTAPQFENIYFDLDKVVLRPEARKVLDEIAAFYHKDPGIRITLSVYTDNTGTNLYNVKLSEERGDSVRAYLVRKGLPPGIFRIKARGNKNPVVSNDTPAGRLINRRVTFGIGGALLSYHPQLATYITKSVLSLDELSALTKNTVAELMQYNGLVTRDGIPAYTPVRIKIVESLENIEDFLLQASAP